ncbi:MAG TPA: nucleoid-associated protein [Bacillota bacterium]|nr:nucleoid-associated protein [Bacillota bacterium]
MDNIRLNKVILHILDNNQQLPVLSAGELELEADTADFLEKHLSRLWGDGELKDARFNPEDNPAYQLCFQLSQDQGLFVETSLQLSKLLFEIMEQNPAIPAGDVVFVLFEVEDVGYFAMLKLNYRHSYIHFVANQGESNVNQLIKQRTTLPGDTQKVDEAFLLRLADGALKVLEKKYEICAEKEFYLSKYFLKCQSDLSYSEKIKILDKSVSVIARKHQTEDYDKVAKLRTCLAENLEETREIKVEQVADAVFGGNSAFKAEYLEEVQKAGLVEETVPVPEATTANKKFRTQKLKTDSGIEINFPSHAYNNTDVMEFINNPDGTISILIKNINKVKAVRN